MNENSQKENVVMFSLGVAVVLATAAAALNFIMPSRVSPFAILLGGGIGALNLFFFRRLVLMLAQERSNSRTGVIIAGLKLPVLLLILFVVSRQGAAITLSFLVGYLSFVPAVFVSSRLRDAKRK